MNTVAVQSNLANLEHAFFVAEKLGVARLLDPEGKIATKGFVAKTPSRELLVANVWASLQLCDKALFCLVL